jgi:energy-coupling factor transporter transmembrane protein EcfT
VINTLAQIDWLASSGTSTWHRASALAKLRLAAFALGLAIAAPSLRLQVALYAAAWTLVATSRLPARLVAAAAGAPLLFIGLVVALRWDGTWETPLRLALRPLTATLLAVWLAGTTPYPDLFAPISRMLPRGAADGLFITYRALFDLLSRAERMFRALHLRGGDRLAPARRLPAAGEGLATLVLYGFERGQRVYESMRLRGHSGRVCGCRHWAERGPGDGAVAMAAAAVAVAAVLLWRAP